MRGLVSLVALVMCFSTASACGRDDHRVVELRLARAGLDLPPSVDAWAVFYDVVVSGKVVRRLKVSESVDDLAKAGFMDLSAGSFVSAAIEVGATRARWGIVTGRAKLDDAFSERDDFALWPEDLSRVADLVATGEGRTYQPGDVVLRFELS